MRAEVDRGTVAAGLLATEILKGAILARPVPKSRQHGSADEWVYWNLVSGLGTGSSVFRVFQQSFAGTSPLIVNASSLRRVEAFVLRDAAERISLIRSTLSLNVTELAAVLHVERPTVYAWIGGTAQPNARNSTRIEAVSAIAREWATFSGLPLGSLRNLPDPSGKSIVNLLKAQALERPRILAAFKAASQKLLADRSRPRGLGLRERAREKGLEIATPPADAQRELDVLTGKRTLPE
jgi:hypothetical protein